MYKSNETFSEAMTRATVWIDFVDVAYPKYRLSPRYGVTVSSKTTIIDVEFLTYDPTDPNLLFEYIVEPKS